MRLRFTNYYLYKDCVIQSLLSKQTTQPPILRFLKSTFLHKMYESIIDLLLDIFI